MVIKWSWLVINNRPKDTCIVLDKDTITFIVVYGPLMSRVSANTHLQAGYKKKLWKKKASRKKRLREIVFCNKTQSKLLDKMTTQFWKRRNWYVNDPYQKYHDRTNLNL